MAYKQGNNGLGLGGHLGGINTYNNSIMTSKTFNESEYHQIEYAEVIAIDLNIDGLGKPSRPENVGRIKFRAMSTQGREETTLPWAFPMTPYYRMYPVIGEMVVIIEFDGRYYWMGILNAINMLNNNLQSNLSEWKVAQSNQSDAKDYKQSQASGIPTNEGDVTPSPGETFKNQRMKIGILSPNEGDTIIEGRFGHSIRLGNNPISNTPNIKISVRDLLETFAIDNEDLNKHSCVFITTDEILTFNAVGIPISNVNNPPSEYSGKQIYITSDRLIFSSKANEILMFSNKTISLASTDNFSVDTNKKVIVHSADNTEINTKKKFVTNSTDNTEVNSSAMMLLSSTKNTVVKSPKIYLGADSASESVVLGNVLVGILKELLTALAAETHPTPSGPSGVPTNAATYDSIKAKLNTALSKRNFTL